MSANFVTFTKNVIQNLSFAEANRKSLSEFDPHGYDPNVSFIEMLTFT